MNADKPAEHMTLTDVECPFPTRRNGVPHFHTFEVDMTLEAGQTLGRGTALDNRSQSVPKNDGAPRSQPPSVVRAMLEFG